MTHAQKKVLDAISAFVAVHGYSPTLRQIANAAGLKSISTVHKHTRRLIRLGLLLGDGRHLSPVVPGGCVECARLRGELKCARRLLEEVRH